MESTYFPRRNEIYSAVLPVTSKSVQYGKRPVLIVQNDIGNEMSPTTIVAPITSRIKRNMPTHVIIGPETGLKNESVVLLRAARDGQYFDTEREDRRSDR